jgi:Periplasmic copper-binding protein (NosD)/RTX calcium-binding nonapeptide repeat (4 copies)
MRLNRRQRRVAKTDGRPAPWRPRLERLEDKLAPAVFTVVNTNDSGPGSLRQAILDAENTPNVGGPDRVEFNIPGDGVHTIFPSHTLSGSASFPPEIIDPVIIDGYTQPGASPNTLAVGDDAHLKIEINCSNTADVLFELHGDNTTVRGLAITHFSSSAFVLNNSPGSLSGANQNTIAGNFIGTDAAGLTCLADGDSRAIVILAGSGNVFGGPTPADRNVITSPRSMFLFQSGTGNVIRGNYIGVNKDGTGPLQPPSGTFGVVISADAGSNTIADNVILGTDTGVSLLEGTTGHNLVQGNFIGTNATGTAALGGFQGIGDQGNGDTIRGNVISGVATGISINHQGPPGPGPTIQGNKIGTDVTGTLPIPNSGDGIFVLSSPGGASIGGTSPGDGNTIALNGRYGVFVNSGAGCSILGNSMFANGNLGINLSGALDGFFGPVTDNDPGDGDGGANGLQNFPVITAASTGPGSTSVAGTLNSTAETTFRLEFFASGAADPSDHGEGQTFLGFTTVTTDASGDASFNVSLPTVGGGVISATATDPAGNTSEFSLDFAATGGDVIIDANTPQSFLDSLTVIHGNLLMVGVAGRTDLRLPNLTQVDGDFIVTDNPDLAVLDAPLLTTVGGNLDVSNNPALIAVELRSVATTGGSVSISDNAGATGIDLASLSTVGGSVSISDNAGATGIDLASLSTVGGSVSISDNAGATGIDLASLSTVGGDESVQAQTSVTAVTADGSTEVKLFPAEAHMTAALATGTFAHPVRFTVTRLDPAALPPETGQSATGGPAVIDPLAAYAFRFATPTLNQQATLTFEINVAALPAGEREAFLAALVAGEATVAVKNDTPGSTYQAFAIADPGQPPADGRVAVTRLDAHHDPLPPGSPAVPAFVRFDGVAGHFSTWAVVRASRTGAVVRDRVLEIVGTAGDDRVRVSAHGPREWLVRASFLPGTHVAIFPRADVDRIHVLLGAGNDRAVVGGGVTPPAILDGGAGDDVLWAGGGPSVLLGGGGNDRLFGGRNRDILVGGAGADRLAGGGQDDVLVAGFTALDGDPTGLLAVEAEWRSARDYPTRVRDLRDGTGSPDRVNGSAFLAAAGPAATAFNDAESDRLFGGLGRDWFFSAGNDFLAVLGRDEVRDVLA